MTDTNGTPNLTGQGTTIKIDVMYDPVQSLVQVSTKDEIPFEIGGPQFEKINAILAKYGAKIDFSDPERHRHDLPHVHVYVTSPIER